MVRRLVLLCLVAGVALRAAALEWNTRLHGDVNLFALTAREYVQHGRLFYPLKHEYTDRVPYRSLAGPATQHPPLFPAMGGALARVLGTDDTFRTLKLVSLAAGLLLVALVLAVGRRRAWRAEALVAAGLLSVSPVLVDYSGNGSPYVVSAALMAATSLALVRFRMERTTGWVVAGVLTAVALQIHMTLVCIPAAFALVALVGMWRNRRLEVRGALVSAAVMALLLAPYVAWNLRHFGRPYYSLASTVFMQRLGLAQEGIYGDVIAIRPTGGLSGAVLREYVVSSLSSALYFGYFIVREVGPFLLVLAMLGCAALLRRNQRLAVAIMLPAMLYAGIVFVWALTRERFAVPLLPSLVLAAAAGYTSLAASGGWRRRAGTALLAGSVLWMVPQYFEHPLTRYYSRDAEFAADYEQMRVLALRLRAEAAPGVVLGYSGSLDAGLETVYWHRFPFVRGRGVTDGDVHAYQARKLRKLVQDFGVRYVWTDRRMLDGVRGALPQASVLMRQGRFYVLEIGSADLTPPAADPALRS